MKELLVIFIGLSLSLFLFGWTLAAKRRAEGKPILENEPRRPVPWGLIDILIFGFLMIGIQVALANLWGVDLKNEDPEVVTSSQISMLMASGISRLVTVAAMFAIIIVTARARFSDLGIATKKLPKDLLVGFTAFAMIAPIVFGLQVFLTKFFKSQHPLIEWLTERPTWMLLYLVAFSAVVVAPIAEEVLFRLLFQGWLEKVVLGRFSTPELVLGSRGDLARDDESTPATGNVDVADDSSIAVANNSDTAPRPAEPNPYVSPQHSDEPDTGKPADIDGRLQFPLAMLPILGSATVFALMHYSHGPDPIPLFLLSLGIGYVYQRTHRILPCILIHMLLNGFSILLLWMQLFGNK